ncbi:SDR family oxidoreductase [Saccharospirillum salsuginis]|uniref:Short-chain dehydrogenase n=1 Tax=Saccharospirillum salsuginis TaxID=418750 RepID=A0A918NA42_9GAMM|nr:SDR family oxidoreductase [Saccharospirillum salsuginis]GGX52768.1 short-chain dehydrogenase [Saccharospirillum salsuginis]
MSDVIVLIGSGAIGLAIARRVSSGKRLLLADVSQENADAAATTLGDAGFDVQAVTVDVTSHGSVEALAHKTTESGDVTGVIHAAGVSPSSAPVSVIFRVDLYGTALVLDVFGGVIANGGSGLVVSSQAGHRLEAFTPEQNERLATTPVDQLLDLDMLQPEQVDEPLLAYQIAKRGASLRVAAEAPRWAERGARVNAISPGFVVTPLSRKELEGPNREAYQRMLKACAGGRPGTPDEIAALGALMMGPDGGFISGSDFLIDGGVTAAYRYGDLEL